MLHLRGEPDSQTANEAMGPDRQRLWSYVSIQIVKYPNSRVLICTKTAKSSCHLDTAIDYSETNSRHLDTSIDLIENSYAICILHYLYT